MRLSRNLAYMIAQHTPGFGKAECTFENFETAGEASFEHHWNNHEHCGEWCQAKSWTEEEKVEKKGKFRDKIKNRKEYEQQMQVKKKYLSTPRLRRCYHEFCNNKTEQLHGLVVNVFLPKRSYFCRTICGRARTYLAMSVDSLGYEGYYRKLYEELGIRMSSVTARYYHQHDQKRKRDRNYAKTPARKKKRAKQQLDQIQKAWQSEVGDKDKGHMYQSRMAAPQVTGTHEETNEGVGGVSLPFCNACGCYGHQGRSSLQCAHNPRNKNHQGAYVHSVRGLVTCDVCKYSNLASLHASTHLSYAFYEKGIQSWPASNLQTELRIAHPAPIPI